MTSHHCVFWGKKLLRGKKRQGEMVLVTGPESPIENDFPEKRGLSSGSSFWVTRYGVSGGQRNARVDGEEWRRMERGWNE